MTAASNLLTAFSTASLARLTAFSSTISSPLTAFLTAAAALPSSFATAAGARPTAFSTAAVAWGMIQENSCRQYCCCCTNCAVLRRLDRREWSLSRSRACFLSFFLTVIVVSFFLDPFFGRGSVFFHFFFSFFLDDFLGRKRVFFFSYFLVFFYKVHPCRI